MWKIFKKFIFFVFCVCVLAIVFFGYFNHKYGLYFDVTGHSMESTIMDGDTVVINPFKTIQEGDVISFECFSKCNFEGKTDKLIKRVKSIREDGAIWVEGDNTPEFSSDSREYGWLAPEDIHIQGVVILIF